MTLSGMKEAVQHRQRLYLKRCNKQGDRFSRLYQDKAPTRVAVFALTKCGQLNLLLSHFSLSTHTQCNFGHFPDFVQPREEVTSVTNSIDATSCEQIIAHLVTRGKQKKATPRCSWHSGTTQTLENASPWKVISSKILPEQPCEVSSSSDTESCPSHSH